MLLILTQIELGMPIKALAKVSPIDMLINDTPEIDSPCTDLQHHLLNLSTCPDLLLGEQESLTNRRLCIVVDWIGLIPPLVNVQGI